ncbi:MAG: hypothetical protein ACIAQU_09790 [Phycisphaerales bacterium JB064]
MRSRHTRIVLAIAGCLVFGLTVSVALAWALCLWPTKDIGNSFQSSVNWRPESEPSYHTVYNWSNAKSVGFRHVAVWPLPGYHPINRHAARRMREEILAGKAGLPPDQIAVRPYVRPAWPSWLATLPEDDTEYAEWGARAAGWPMLCLASRSSETTTGPRQTSWSLRLWSPAATGGSAPRDPDRGAVPLRPLPLGLAANTLLFAAPLFVVLVAVPTVRRAIRRRRGRCPACGYDRRGLDHRSPCPECGTE